MANSDKSSGLFSALDKLAGKLPFQKLSSNQTFDLVFDVLMLIYVMMALGYDLGPSQPVLKPILVLSAFGVIYWSFHTNKDVDSAQPPKPRNHSAKTPKDVKADQATEDT